MTKSSHQAVALARLFSANVFHELAQFGRSPMFARLLPQLDLSLSDPERLTVAETFDIAFAILRRADNRNDHVYRVAVAQTILMGKHSLNTASMLSEFRTGSSKADIVILNGTATVYEIKSERDTLARLSGQIEDYQKVFAKVNVVCGKDHLYDVLKLVPDSVGVMQLKRWNRISTHREARDCSAFVDPVAILSSLRATEAIAILKMLDRDIPSVPNTILRTTLREIYQTLDPILVHAAMVKALRMSRNLLSLADLVADVPVSLKPATLTCKMRKGDADRVVQALNTPIIEAQQWV